MKLKMSGFDNLGSNSLNMVLIGSMSEITSMWTDGGT